MRIIPSSMIAILIFQLVPLAGGGSNSSAYLSITEHLQGDMNIPFGETLLLENRTIEMDGNITIAGTLVLKNVSLLLENPNMIRNNGTLLLLDLDGNSSTQDGSALSKRVGTLVMDCKNGSVGCHYSAMDQVMMTYGDLNMSHSTVSAGSTFYSGIYAIEHSVLYARIVDPDPSSVIRSSSIIGRMDILGQSGADYVFEGIAFSGGSDHSLWIDQGNLTMRDCTIQDVDFGIILGTKCNVELRGVGIKARKYNLYCPETEVGRIFNLMDCSLTKGETNLGLGTGYIYRCEFDGSVLSNISSGRISESLFRDGLTAILNVNNANITRNHFKDIYIGVDDMASGKLYHNGFINVTAPFLDVSASVSIYVNREGNYYSDYVGKDDGSGNRRADDGIGDEGLPHLHRDHWPLMFDNFWWMPTLPLINATAGSGDPNITVRVLTRQEERFIIQDSSSEDFKDDLRSFSTRGRTLIIPECENGTHFIRARAFNSFGSRGWGDIAIVSVDRWPLPPEILSVSVPPDGSKVNITWRYVGSDILKTEVSYSDEGKGQTIDVMYPTATLTVKGLKNDQLYKFELYTWDRKYRSRTPTVFTATARDLLPPGPPRNLQGEPVDNASIALRWIPPQVQDISRYQVLRMDPDDDYRIIYETENENVLTYVDRGLRDNTTYRYGVRAVDDDGPISEMGGPVSISTKHINSAPEFIGDDHTYDRKEGDPPLIIDIYSKFIDPDGDILEIEVSEADPFPSHIERYSLIIAPEEDQYGQGHVQLMVDDGEERVYYLVWIFIEPTPDPPRIVEIIEPQDNSILVPGEGVRLIADIEDPDLPDDALTVTWTSDRDGTISVDTGNGYSADAELTPGIHRLTLLVKDRANTTDTLSVTVAVSIWGFRQPMWNFTVQKEDSYLSGGGFFFTSTIQNDAGITLTFRCTLLLEGNGVNDEYERVLVLNGGADGTVTIQGRIPIRTGEFYNVTYTVRAETMNGTFAGTRNETYVFRSEERADDPAKDLALVVVASVGTLFLLIVAGTYAVLAFRKNNKSNGEMNR